MSGLERTTYTVGEGFNPDSAKHQSKLLEAVAKEHGGGFEIESYDPASQSVSLTRRSALTTVVSHADSEALKVNLAGQVRAADAERYSVSLTDTYPGYVMTSFEPHRKQAILAKLSDEVILARDTLSNALRVRPWEIQVSKNGSGFSFSLPPTYMPSKHDEKLAEAAEMVGEPGWYVETNIRTRSGKIVKAEPPTFEGLYPTPIDAVEHFDHTKKSHYKIPLGMKLPRPGGEHETLELDLDAAPHAQLGGISNSGKAQRLDAQMPVPVSERFPAGWAKNDELEVGDRLYGPDGKTTRVTGFSSVTREPIYRVHFGDKQHVDVSGNHLWRVSTAYDRLQHSPKKISARHKRQDDYLSRAHQIETLAASMPPGSVSTLPEISEMAGYSKTTLTTLSTQAADFNVKHLGVDMRVPNRKKARLISTAEIASVVGADGVTVGGQHVSASLIEGKRLDAWMTVRDFATAVLGEPASRDQADLWKGWISRHRDQLRTNDGYAHATKVVYPVDETLTMLAKRLHRLAYTSDSGVAVGPIEQVLSTQQMKTRLDAPHAKRHNTDFAVRVPEPITGETEDLPVDPYVLGVWLGEGARWSPDRATLSNQEVLDEVVRAGYPVRRTEAESENFATYVFDYFRKDLAAAGITAKEHRKLPAVKHIPPKYLRASVDQRRALLAGLIDTDGHISAEGRTEITLSDQRLITDVLELIRSLGIKATTPEAQEAAYRKDGEKIRVKDRYRIHFTSHRSPTRRSDNLSRLPDEAARSQVWNHITDIEIIDDGQVRCIAVDHPEHLYLTEGFIPTHNTVMINAYVYHWLNRGAQMAIIDTPVKSVDFMWCRDFLMESGWGCDSTFHAATTSQMIIDLYKARSSQMKREGYQNFKDMPAGKGFAPVVVVIDEVSNLFQTTEVPKANQDSPEKLQQMKADAEAENFATNVLKKNITRIAADARFAGVFLLLSTQIATQNTGIGTDLRTNLGHKALMGVGPTDRQRANVFSDADSVPKVPENIKADAAAAKGVGAFDPEGARPTVFKSYFATIDDYRRRLDEAGVVTRDDVRPPASEVIEIFGEETIPEDVQL